MLPTSCRIDGWTPERQRTFLEALAEGVTVEGACARAGMSVASAYAFRKRAAGAAFALGWRAAALQARERLEGAMWSRAIDGYSETATRADGSIVTRHKFDNRLAMSLLTRLDRIAEATDAGGAFGRAARFAAQDFDGFLDTLEGGALAETVCWLGRHLRDDVPEALGAFHMLDVADRHVRNTERNAAREAAEADGEALSEADGTGGGDEPDDASDDEFPGLSQRQGWSAAEWARAPAIELPDPPECAWNPQLPQHRDEDDEAEAAPQRWPRRRPVGGAARRAAKAPALPRRVATPAT